MITAKLMEKLIEWMSTGVGSLITGISIMFILMIMLASASRSVADNKTTSVPAVKGISPHTEWQSSVVPREKTCEGKECGGYDSEKDKKP